MKIRTFVLWIMGSDERRQWWTDTCNIFTPLDVNSRWNGLYLMMQVARKYKAQISRYGRDHPTCQYLVPTEVEWEMCEQVERCLEPFYNHTLTVSNDVPSLPQYLGIMWGLTDLLDDVSSGEGVYGGISSDLQSAFESAKDVLKKRTDYMIDNDLYFAAHALDPRVKFSLI
jgi:hypothetical protein